MNKRQFVVVVVVAALAGFAGAHMAMRFSTREAIAAEQPEIAQSIKVRRLNIVDDAGRTLVYLGTVAGEDWGLVINDAGGRIGRISLLRNKDSSRFNMNSGLNGKGGVQS